MIKDLLKNNSGLTSLLSVTILVAVTGLALIIANSNLVILRVNKSIGGSEKAIYAAETAAEITIFQIEKEGKGLNLPKITDKVMDGDTGVTWSREVIVSYKTPGVCNAFVPKPICSNNDDNIRSSNILYVTLNGGQSFQFDLNIAGADYPDRLQISWTGSGTSVLVYSSAGQTEYTSSPVTIPASGTLDPVLGYRIKITNNSGNTVTYALRPQGGATTDLPMGLLIRTEGKYQSYIRKLEIVRPAWIIY